MASNPPLSVMEDQTDEDFFDKLVDDDDDDFGPTNLTSKFGEGGSDSDEAKAFANLSVEDVDGEGGLEENGGKDYVDENEGLSNVHFDEGATLSGVIESDGFQGVVASDLGASKDTGSMNMGVKEVGWSSFHADMLPNGSHGVGDLDFFNDLGDSLDDFFGKVDENVEPENVSTRVLEKSGILDQHGDGTFGGDSQEAVNGQGLDNSHYWENTYPGWTYDSSTGQWYQVDSFDTAAITQGTYTDAGAGAGAGESEWSATSNGKMAVNYLQQSLQSVGETVAEARTTESVSSWNQVSQGNNNGYPDHMVFDPQYPGWYYDMLAQEWRSLESYASSIQPTVARTPEQQIQNGMASGAEYSHIDDGIYNECGHSDNYGLQEYNSQAQHSSWGDSHSSYNQQSSQMWQLGTAANTETISTLGGNQQIPNSFASYSSSNNHVDHQKSVNPLQGVSFQENVSQAHNAVNGFVGFGAGGNFGQRFDQRNLHQNEQMSFQSSYYSNQKPVNMPQQVVHGNEQFSYAPSMGRSSAGRPPHSLVTFGFGGKIIVMKDATSLGKSSFSPQEPAANTISVLNLMEVVLASTGYSSVPGGGSSNYFSALCQQSFPGPLVGGSVGNKEVNKWIDERIANCESADLDYRKGEVLKLLLSLLKISCQHYGKLRSPFGDDASLRENDAPEAAVAKLFASVKRNGTQMNAYGALGHCLKNLPSDRQVLATASEMQNLLVSGRKKEALQCAQEGQLWGPALVLASQLGDQFFVDTVKQMALHQLVAGSPLRTLCLLIAGQPAEVFSTGIQFDGSIPGALNVSQQPLQSGENVMLDDWENNLAVITANRTKDDELVIIHLGDCLWKDGSEITSAHICYLVAEANFEPYSDTARLCLIAADHWKHPRTYASPEAIQRTELYEYSKVLGNSQFILLPFQPYKLIYAYMLAEVGRVSDSLKYCQAVLKSLKTGRAPEVEAWRQSVLSLEERLRTHQQGGYAANLAPAKLVGKLLNFFDSTAHRVVGGLPPPVPSTSHGSTQNSEHFQSPMVPRVSSSQSTMAMSSLMPSSMESISEWAADGNKRAMHNRSVSEPDFSRSPRQVDSSKEGTPSSVQSKSSSSGSSRFGRFGFGSQIFQKTMGLVLRPRSDKQAKLGESNKFYYDEKLKRWVEEGAEPPTEEAALPPPPTNSAFQNSVANYSLKSALTNDATSTNGSPAFKSPSSTEITSGIPPIPTSSNQFSARGRMGVRARYVDTFNQGGGSSANLFHSPSVPSVKPAVVANAKFFIPSAAPASVHSMMEAIAENAPGDSATAENSLISTASNSFHSPASASSVTMQRFPSMDSMRKGAMHEDNGPISSHSRRTASWGGSVSDAFSPPKPVGPKLLGDNLNIPPSPFTPIDSPTTTMPKTGSSFGDLHEVEL